MLRKTLSLVLLFLLISCCKKEAPIKLLLEENKKEENQVVVINFKNIVMPKASKAILDEQIELLKNTPKAGVDLSGYCALDASKRFNLDIATKRAEAVRSYLIRSGISAARIRVMLGYDGGNFEYANKCIVALTQNN